MAQHQQRNSVPIDVQLRPVRVGNSRHRRSSWHSCLSDSDYEDLEPGHVVHRSGSSQGFDSDCNVESDDEAFDQLAARFQSHDHDNGIPQQMTLGGSPMRKYIQRSQSLAVNPTPSGIRGLKGGARGWNVEPGNGARAGPQIPPVMQEGAAEVDTGTLPPRAKALVNERVSEHRERILRYFQQVIIPSSTNQYCSLLYSLASYDNYVQAVDMHAIFIGSVGRPV